MKWSELPQEYKNLEKNFKESCATEKDVDEISEKFFWDSTPQGDDFWWKCLLAEDISELPPIEITDYKE